MTSSTPEKKQQFIAKITRVTDLSPQNPDHVRLTIDCGEIAGDVKPGQFLHILPPGNLDLLRRPISVMDVNHDTGEIEILLRIIGDGTRLIAGASAGDKLDIIGPLGNGYSIIPDRPAVLIGGGVGIPPLFYLAKILLNTGIKPRVLLGAKDTSTLICEKDFISLGLTPGITTEDGSVGTKGFVTQLMKNDDTKNTPVVYACGPIPMLKAVYVKSIELGWSDCFISLENKLACGIGACLGCSIPVTDNNDKIHYERVCVEGPVFDASRVVFDRMM